jgi:2-polyprenyl-3-methyl-5-hydroxy-6-metoxy-1,4-benzoquinol methylase
MSLHLAEPPARRAVDRDCICCGARRWAVIYDGIVGCGACGYQRISQELTLADLESIYGHAFFSGDKYHDYAADKAILQRNFEVRLRSVLRLCQTRGNGPARHLDLLEVGAAYGFFLELAKPHFRSARGIDIAREATAAAREAGLDVTTGDLLDAHLEPESFDVIAMWDTIEHLNRPELYCARVLELLRPGGLFVATTGDVSSLLARVQRRKWRLYDPPVHVHYFSRRSLGMLLFNLGFGVVAFESCAFTHSVEQIVHGLGMYTGRQDGALGRLCRWLYPRLPASVGAVSLPLDVGDIFMIAAQKPLPS